MKSFLQGKKTLDIAPLRPSTSFPPAHAALRQPTRPAAPHDHRPAAGGPSGASVEVVKEGDKVVRLVITCTCGERVEVECLYPAGS
jgi:hypothetical protein